LNNCRKGEKKKPRCDLCQQPLFALIDRDAIRTLRRQKKREWGFEHHISIRRATRKGFDTGKWLCTTIQRRAGDKHKNLQIRGRKWGTPNGERKAKTAKGGKITKLGKTSGLEFYKESRETQKENKELAERRKNDIRRPEKTKYIMKSRVSGD